MKVKGKKATATLTDVKNKIGDVFSLVDEHGSVTITSYNKPKYLISKYKDEKPVELPKRVHEASQLPVVAVAPAEAQPVAVETAKVETKPVSEKPQKAPQVAVEEVSYEPEVTTDLPVPQKLVSEVDVIMPVTKAEQEKPAAPKPPKTDPDKLIKPIEQKPDNDMQILAHTTYAEIWNRNSASEQAWVQKVRDLL